MLVSLIILFAFYLGLFFLSVKLKDNSIVDIFWGFGFLVIANTTFFLEAEKTTDQIMITILISLWWIRLFMHILSKWLNSSWEDFRYQEFRRNWEWFYTRSFFQVYMLQFIIMLIIAIPIFLVNIYWNYSENILYLYVVGAFVAFFGLVYESIADYQMKKFKENKNPWEILTSWLFRYSRFPQYFGESVFWLGISLMGIGINILSIISYILILGLLLFVSWIPYIEEKYKNNPWYQKYKKQTNKFIPGPPRNLEE